MNKAAAQKETGGEPTLASEVRSKALRKLKSRQNPTNGTWFGLGMMGLIGWSVAVPTLLGTALGIWLEDRYPGKTPWTLALLVAGLSIGCFNAWCWVAKEDEAMKEEQEESDE
jgi:ATP synthase protein I